MNPPESLLQAAHRDADPTAALACADWYDEHDQPEQARLMRLSVRLEQLGPGHPDALAIELEAEKLGLWLEWQRQINPEAFAGMEGSLAGVSVRGLPVWYSGGHPSKIATNALPWFDREAVRGVAVGPIEPRQLATLLRSSIGQRLVRLSIITKRDDLDSCLRELARVASTLDLCEIFMSIPEDGAGLTRQSPWEGLVVSHRLSLSGAHVSPATLTHGLCLPMMRNVKHVSLQSYQSTRGSFSESQLAKLGDLDKGPRLRSWTTSGYQYAPTAMRAFAHADLWPDLESLTIHGNPLSYASIRPVAHRLQRGTLRSLDLGTISRGAHDFFQEAGDTPGLRELHWRLGAATPLDWASLAAWPGLTTVTRLGLNLDSVYAPDLARLLQSPHARALQRLRIQSPLDEGCMDQVAENIASESLRSLSIGIRISRERTIETLIRMLHSSGFSQIHELIISSEIIDRDVSILAEHLDLPNLTRLRMDLFGLELMTLQALLNSPRLPRLAIVELEDEYEPINFDPRELPDGWYVNQFGTFIHPERLR